MTNGERISIIAYVRERFDSQDEKLDGIVARLEALEAKEDRREGRDTFITKAAKAFATAVVTVGAAIGAYLGLKPH